MDFKLHTETPTSIEAGLMSQGQIAVGLLRIPLGTPEPISGKLGARIRVRGQPSALPRPYSVAGTFTEFWPRQQKPPGQIR